MSNLIESDLAREKILKFKQYREGWDYGDGVPFNRNTIWQALSLNRILMLYGVSKTNAFPGADGSIMVVGYLDPWCWEFIIEPDRTITVVTEKDGSVVKEEENLSLNDAINIIKSNAMMMHTFKPKQEKEKGICFSSEFLTPKNTILIGSDIPVRHSNLLDRPAAFQPLTANASEQKVIASVPTLNSTTVTPLAIP